MADSDSDEELHEDILMDTEDKPADRPKKKARSKEQKYIYEDADTIVDLADTKSMRNIACKYLFSYEKLKFVLDQLSEISFFFIKTKSIKTIKECRSTNRS